MRCPVRYRIAGYCRLSDQTLVASLVLLNRVLTENSRLTLSSRTIHKLLLCTSLVSAKVVEDRCCSNKAFAEAGGVAVKELNMLEREILHLLDHSLFVDPEE